MTQLSMDQPTPLPISDRILQTVRERGNRCYVPSVRLALWQAGCEVSLADFNEALDALASAGTISIKAEDGIGRVATVLDAGRRA